MKTQGALYVSPGSSYPLFAATMKTQGALYASQGSSYPFFAAAMKTQGALYMSQGSFYTLRGHYENSEAFYSVRDPPTLFAATMKTQVAL
jgi:hypothetical protein